MNDFEHDQMEEAFSRALEEDLADPDGYWNSLNTQIKLQEKRFDKFELWLETNNFEEVFQKLLKKNGKNRKDWCYKRGIQKYGTPLMEFLCDYVSKRTKHRRKKKIENIFQSGLWEFKGYWFQLICGQGCFWRIYDSKLKRVEDV